MPRLRLACALIVAGCGFFPSAFPRFVASFSPQEWQFFNKGDAELGADALTMEERIELLVNRCFVRVTKSDQDRWPYYEEDPSAGLA